MRHAFCAVLAVLSISSLASANDDDDLERVLKNAETMSEEAAERLEKPGSTSLVTPTEAPAKVEGFKVEKVTPNSMYDQLGLKPGDVIKSYNGTKLDESGASVKLVEALKKAGKLELNVDRGGIEETLNYSVTPTKPKK